MKRLLLLAAAGALGACAHRPEPGVIPTPVPCRVEIEENRTFPFDRLEPGADIFTQVATLLADRRERIADRREIVAAAKVCS